MTVRRALRLAARDLYANSWRVLAVNTTLSAVVLALLAAAAFVPPAIILLPLAGPLAAALANTAVLIVREENPTVRDAFAGARVHARRGIVLGAIVTLVFLVAEHAARFYATRGVWLLSMVVIYLLALYVLHQLFAWTLAVAEPQRPLRHVYADAAAMILRRPGQAFGLALALLAIEGVAAMAGVLPLLMLGGGFAFLAAAQLAAPEPVSREEAAWQA
jgi:uncharacterized membrane protein